MSFDWIDILLLLGSLTIFIYGMKVMSEGIQRFAGGQLRSILTTVTGNKIAGIATGFVTTSIIQSSSATTVMIVSFVNAGLLTLRQAIGVIMGANIGTTVTAVIIAFFGFSKINLGDFGLIVAAFAVPLMLTKNSKSKAFADFLIGFALILLGLLALKNSVPEFSPNALEFLQKLGNYGFFSTILFIFIGTILTVALQSSTAAIALTLALCEKGIIDFPMAMAIVLGENIGTTITANIAAIVGNVSAKRAARAHLLFNILGVIWVIPFLSILSGIIADYLVNTSVGSPYENIGAVKWGLMLFHVIFNLLNTCVLMWFIPQIILLATKMVPKNNEEAPNTLEYIGTGVMSTAELSILEAQKELIRFSKLVHKMCLFTNKLSLAQEKNEFDRIAQKIERYEEITDKIEIEIANYLSKISEGELSKSASYQVRKMLNISSNLEKIADIFYTISKIYIRKNNDRVWFSPEQRNNINAMFKLVEKAIVLMVKNLSAIQEKEILDEVQKIENEINALRNILRNDYLIKVENGEMTIKTGLIYNNLFSYYEEIGDKIVKISEALHSAEVNS